jgi:hypothetical protein
MNVDILTGLNLKAMINYHRKLMPLATLQLLTEKLQDIFV